MAIQKKPLLFVALAVLVLGGGALAVLHWPHAASPAASFVGTQACAACHQEQFNGWQSSHHRHAMEVPDQDSVLGDFNDARFDYFGTRSHFFTRDGKYFVETDNADGQLQTFQVAYTFGWYPLQQYLIAFPDGRLQALSLSWDSRPAAAGGQRWYHLYPDEEVTADDPLHWTGAFQNWNSRCASCHSTSLTKNYSAGSNTYSTRWEEVTVGCEACHGAGSRHIAWSGGDTTIADKGLLTNLRKVWEPVGGARPIPQQVDQPLSGQLQVCSGCHSRRTELQQPDVAASYFGNYALSPLLDGLYFADGQIHEEVYETGSFLQSRMHQNHVSCTNCHDPHSGGLRATGNALCGQCHQADRYDNRAHHFHDAGSGGARCINCHMPERTYMGVDARRDHSFRVPDPAASLRFGTPNACTQCHKDRTDQWAAQVITRQTGRKEPWYPHTALLAGAHANELSRVADLAEYASDAGRPAILRAIAIQESGRFPSRQQLDAASEQLLSADPLIRAGAVAALAQSPASERLARLKPLLNDPAKSVRIAVARQLVDILASQQSAEVRPALEKLFDEYTASLLYNADMPESMSDLALFRAAQGDVAGAEQALMHARRLSPRYLPALLNLSDLYRARSRDDLGEPLLREAVMEYPQSGDAHHMLGLLLVRTGRRTDAIAELRAAATLAPGNPQYLLVYAVALVETGSPAEGIRVLEGAAQRFPGNTGISDALRAYKARQR